MPHGDETPSESSPAPTPRNESPARPHGKEKVKVIHHRAKKTKRSYAGVLLLGTLIGLVAAGFFAKNDYKLDFDLSDVMGDLSMESLLEVIPAGFMKDMRQMVVSCRGYGLEYCFLYS